MFFFGGEGIYNGGETEADGELLFEFEFFPVFLIEDFDVFLVNFFGVMKLIDQFIARTEFVGTDFVVVYDEDIKLLLVHLHVDEEVVDGF
jgi:hypothetical protein